MFNSRFFPNRYFATRYWAKVGATPSAPSVVAGVTLGAIYVPGVTLNGVL